MLSLFVCLYHFLQWSNLSSTVFFSGFTNHQQLLRSLVQVKNVLASRIKFTRRYWLIKKEKWNMCNRVIFTHLYMSLFLSICPSILPSVAHCIRNCTSSDYNFWYTCVKWWHLQACFFFFFFIFFKFWFFRLLGE